MQGQCDDIIIKAKKRGRELTKLYKDWRETFISYSIDSIADKARAYEANPYQKIESYNSLWPIMAVIWFNWRSVVQVIHRCGETLGVKIQISKKKKNDACVF